MNRCINLSMSCAVAALLGLTVADLTAQQAPAGGRGRGNAPATQNPPSTQQPSGRGAGRGNMDSGTTVTSIGSVRIPRAMKADGQSLPAGTYSLRVTEREASPAAPGQTPQYERWAEFLQGGQVKGREVVTVVPQSDIAQVAEQRPPASGACRQELLKGNDYYRIWCHRGNNHYLVHLGT
jgi:hypothetical protein